MVTKLFAVTVFMLGVVMFMALGNENARDGKLLASGNFVTLDGHTTSGTVEKIQKDNGTYIHLSDDFSTTKGPALKVILHKQAWTETYGRGDYVVLGDLKELKGEQTYQVPNGLNLAEYKSVVIWCDKFKVPFGTAHLTHNEMMMKK